MVLFEPHGRFDAWYTWNARARFLFRGGSFWSDAFSPLLAHSDYPLLIPLNIVRRWHYFQREQILVPAVIHGLFIFSSVGLLVSSVSMVRSRFQGLLAGITLVGTPFFIFIGADQIADVPVSFYYLATIILFFLHDQSPEGRRGILILAGVMAGFSGWTKNEGLVFLLSIPLARLAAPWKGWKTYQRAMSPFLTGLLPILLVILTFKIGLAPSSDILGTSGREDLLLMLSNIPRHIFLIQSFGIEAWRFGFWSLISIFPPLGSICRHPWVFQNRTHKGCPTRFRVPGDNAYGLLSGFFGHPL